MFIVICAESGNGEIKKDWPSIIAVCDTFEEATYEVETFVNEDCIDWHDERDFEIEWDGGDLEFTNKKLDNWHMIIRIIEVEENK